MSAPVYPANSSLGKDIQKLILHLGGIQFQDVPELLAILSRYGAVCKHEILENAGKLSIRVELDSTLAQKRLAKHHLARTHPHARLKLIQINSSLKTKIFVKIHPTHSKHALAAYFSKFGQVQKIEIKFDLVSKRARSFCYVIFDSEESANNVLELKEHTLGNKFLYCERCQLYQIAAPREKTNPVGERSVHDDTAPRDPRGARRYLETHHPVDKSFLTKAPMKSYSGFNKGFADQENTLVGTGYGLNSPLPQVPKKFGLWPGLHESIVTVSAQHLSNPYNLVYNLQISVAKTPC